MTPCELADELAEIRRIMMRSGSYSLSFASVIEQSITTLRAQADEIDALRAAAIVQGSLKLDEAVKVAKQREAVRTAWKRITGSLGWLSCVDGHDSRCCVFFNPHECACGADAFRRMMEE